MCEKKTKAEVSGWSGPYGMNTIPRVEIVPDKEWYDIYPAL